MKIAAFNAKNLGMKKVKDEVVVSYLTKIISRYSVVVILEVVDSSGAAMKELHRKLNTGSNRNRPYSMIASVQLGRDTYKEKFVCFYRMDEVTLITSYQYEDQQPGDEDVFAREPFILHFRCPTTVVKDLVLIPVHTKPDDSLKELDELEDVVQSVREKWRTDNIMILGDFNADGRYLSNRKKGQIRIRSDPYHWLIGDEVDTTTSNNNDNTYDRIVVYGQTMLDAVVHRSAKSFNFQRAYRLSIEKSLSISDHYPVEVELKTIVGSGARGQRRMRSTRGQAQKKGPQKKGARAAGPQRKRKRGQSSDVPAKRRRLQQ